MKIVCPSCGTNYQIDDSKISEKGLLVKCSVCQNKFRVKKDGIVPEAPKEAPKKAVEEDKNMSAENDLFESNRNSADHSMDSLFSSMPANSNKAADDLDALLGGEAPAGGDKQDDGFKVTSSHDEIGSEQDLFEKQGVSMKSQGDGGLDLANDRFDDDADGLFADDPAESQKQGNGADALFSDDVDADAEALFGSDAKKEADSLFGDDDNDDLFSDLKSGSRSSVTAGSDKPAGKGSGDLFDDDADSLFSDSPSSGAQGSAQSSDDFLKDLFGDGKSAKPDKQMIWFRNKQTGKVLGPVDESEVDDLMINGEITEDDDISYDGVNWNGSEVVSSSLRTEEPTSGGSKLTINMGDDKLDSFDSLLFEEGTVINKEDGDGTTDFQFEETSSGTNVDHVYIPDDFSEPAAKNATPAKKFKRGGNPVLFYAGISVATLALLAIIAGGAYFFYSKRNSSENVLDNISEQIAVNLGTLADVKLALDKDLPEDYVNSIGILKQYIKPEESVASAVGLDGQIKFNLLISYGRRIEPSSVINEKIDAAMKNDPGNIDLAKAKALYLYDQKQYDAAAAVIKPFAEENDQEIFYILGLLATGKNDLQNAENFFNTGFIQGGGKSVKIMFALANMKYQNGDTQSAMAFINRIISESPHYLKAYLLKSKILMNSENKLNEAEQFLKNIDQNIIAKAEDFQKAEYYQALATIAHKRGLLQEAIKYYEKAVEINRTDVEAIAKIADFYVQISDSTKAMEYYEKALKIDAKHAASIIGKTEIYVLLNQKEKIYLELVKLDVKNLNDPQLLARVGKIYSNIGDKVKALEFYDLAIKADPSYIEPYLAKAYILLIDFNKVKDLDQIVVVLENLGKDRYPYYLVKAVIDHKNAEYQKAAEHFRIANEKNSVGDDRVYFFYGEFLKDQQKYAEASRMLEKSYKANPKNYDYLQSYVDSLEQEKKWNTVISLLESQTFIEKRMYRSYTSLANAYFHIEEYSKALAAINHALELNTQNTYIYYLKAKIYYEMGRYPEAEKDIDTAVVLDMKNFDNYMLYARVLSKRGDYKGAIEKIEAAEKLDPHDQDLLLMKGVIYKNLDDYRNALMYFSKVTNKELKKEAYLEIGESYLQLNNRKKALEYLLKAEKSGNRGAAKHIASIYYESNNIEKAISYYKKVLRSDKNNTDAMDKLGHIYKEKGDAVKAISYLKLYLKKIEDSNEKRMVEDEIYYLQQSLPQGKNVKEADPNEYDPNDSEAANQRAKELYMEGKTLKEEDPETAKERFREVMKVVPKGNEYYKKAFKALNQLNQAK